MEHLVNDAREVAHPVVEGVADGLAPQGGQAQAQHKGQHHRREGVEQGRDLQAEVALQGVAGCGGDLLQGAVAHEAGEQGVRHQEGCGASRQGGQIGQNDGDEQQLARAAFQVGDAHGHIGQDHQGDDEGQERAEDAGQGDHDPAEPHGQELSKENTDDDCDNELGEQTEFEFLLFHKNPSYNFAQIPSCLLADFSIFCLQ